MRNGKKTIRKELIKNMIFNIVLFTILFTVFSLFIFYQVDKYLYTSIDSQLMQIKANLSDITRMNPPDDFKKPRVTENSNAYRYCRVLCQGKTAGETALLFCRIDTYSHSGCAYYHAA